MVEDAQMGSGGAVAGEDPGEFEVAAGRALVVPGGAGQGLPLLVPIDCVASLEYFANGQLQKIVFRDASTARRKKGKKGQVEDRGVGLSSRDEVDKGGEGG